MTTEVTTDTVTNEPTDLTPITEQLELIIDSLTSVEVVEVDGEEKTQIQLLLEVLNELKPTDGELQQENERLQNEYDVLLAISDNLNGLNELLQENHTNVIEQLESTDNLMNDGFFFVGLAVLVSFGVYMFWNQITKW